MGVESARRWPFARPRYEFNQVGSREYDRVFIIMNGPGAASLNWDEINKELANNQAAALVTNAMLSSGKLIDSENVIFLNNDPVLDLILASPSPSLTNSELLGEIERNYQVSSADMPVMESYFNSCKALLDSKNITVASADHSRRASSIGPMRRIVWKVPLWARIFNRTFYAWHGDGSVSPSKIKRWGPKTWPVESRLWLAIKESKILRRLWYVLNFHQTCNTWYRALDLAAHLKSAEICFIGRNSQIGEWLNPENKKNGSIQIGYKTFTSDHTLLYEIGSFEGIIREMLYSSQYLNMLSGVFGDRKIISLDKTLCYLDFYSKALENKYTINGMENKKH